MSRGSLAVLALILCNCARTREQGSTIAGSAQPLHSPAFRTVYPYSLIEGGIASDGDFARARAIDPVLRRHYEDVGTLRPVSMQHQTRFFASYKRDGVVYWTSKRVTVEAGEVVFSDRSGNLIRGRCGNRLSERAQLPIEFRAPPMQDFDTAKIELPLAFIEAPLMPADAAPFRAMDVNLPEFVAPQTPSIDAPGTGLSPDWWLIPVITAASAANASPSRGVTAYAGPRPAIPPSLPIPLIPSPEPGTFVLGAAAIGALAFISKFRKSSGR